MKKKVNTSNKNTHGISVPLSIQTYLTIISPAVQILSVTLEEYIVSKQTNSEEKPVPN